LIVARVAIAFSVNWPKLDACATSPVGSCVPLSRHERRQCHVTPLHFYVVGRVRARVHKHVRLDFSLQFAGIIPIFPSALKFRGKASVTAHTARAHAFLSAPVCAQLLNY